MPSFLNSSTNLERWRVSFLGCGNTDALGHPKLNCGAAAEQLPGGRHSGSAFSASRSDPARGRRDAGTGTGGWE